MADRGTVFERWGRLVARRRGLVLLASSLVLAASLVMLARGGELLTYEPPKVVEAGRALVTLEEELESFRGAYFELVLEHPTLTTDDPRYRAALEQALAPVERDARVLDVESPWEVPEGARATRLSDDGTSAIVVVELVDASRVARAYYPEIRALVAEGDFRVLAAGGVALEHDFEGTLQEDLERAEIISLPVTLVLLVIVFGTVVSALLPLGVGILAVAGGIGSVLFLSHFTDMSVYAMNIVTLIGLGVAIDYSLFIVKRFREELKGAHGRADVEAALGRTMATSGRATAFSGLTVAIGLGGLVFYKGTYFAAMGVGGTIVVAFAVFYALTFLPAVLALLGARVNRLAIPFAARRESGGTWRRIAHAVMARPLVVLVPALALVLVAGAPFTRLNVATALVESLPEDMEARRGDELVREKFPDRGTNRILVMAEFPTSDPLDVARRASDPEHPVDPLTPERVGALFDLSRAIAAIDGVIRVESVVDLDPSVTKDEYQRLYSLDRDRMPPDVRPLLEATVGEHVVVLTAVTDESMASDAARTIVREIREQKEVADGRLSVTGETAIDVDTIGLIASRTPYAIAFIVVTTYFLLLVQTGSVVLPAKAVLMNFLSIAASFGAVVWVFQDGNLASVLDFTPGPVDPSLPVLLFCIVFGLSMDYEVLMLSRMHEEYERSGDNTRAVAEGLERSGALITGAAAIMVGVFASFATAEVVVIKAIGLGLALAIAIDATLVRALIVPATMRLMGNLNWWAPRAVRELARGL